MINIVAFITPKSEFYGECKQRITDVLSITRAEEGCIRFEIYENKTTKQLVFVETFTSQITLDEHYAQPYILPIFEFYQTALQKEPEIHKLSLIE
ncbi:MAG: putative quinol monooxygenase [Marinomonas colpomeniae]